MATASAWVPDRQDIIWIDFSPQVGQAMKDLHPMLVLSPRAFNAFFFNMINGRGWVCVALVVFASWRPGKALLGALLFAFFDALQLRLQTSGIVNVPYQLYLMLPYVLSILALVLVARKAAYPQALMKPYRKGER